MDILTAESDHRNLYAPAFVVKIDGKDLVAGEGLEVSSVQVDRTMRGLDSFSLSINGSFNIQDRHFHRGAGPEFDLLAGMFKFGAAVEIHMGYKDSGSLTLLHRGVITSIKSSFPSGGLPDLQIGGYDASYCMTIGKNSFNWDNKKDSEIAVSLAGKYKLKAIAQDSKVVHPKIEQNEESDYEFLRRLAKRNPFELYSFDNTLHFRERVSGADRIVAELEWGKGLVSFSPEINIHEQVQKVTVRGWNVQSKKEINGVASIGDELGRQNERKSGGEYLRGLCKEDVEVDVRQPVYSEQEARERARAILKSRSESFVTGSGESIGLPEIRPDSNIKLRGIGTPFSKTYYIEQCTHTINSSGYKTTFKVRDTTI